MCVCVCSCVSGLPHLLFTSPAWCGSLRGCAGEGGGEAGRSVSVKSALGTWRAAENVLF